MILKKKKNVVINFNKINYLLINYQWVTRYSYYKVGQQSVLDKVLIKRNYTDNNNNNFIPIYTYPINSLIMT